LKAERFIKSSNLGKTGQGSPRWHDDDIRLLKSMNNARCHPVKGESRLNSHFSY